MPSSLLSLALALLPLLPSDQPSPLVARGRVVDQAGAPIADAAVFTYPVAFTEGLGTACEYVRTNLERSTTRYCATCQTDRGSRVVTDAAGEFEIVLPDPRRNHYLTAAKPGYLPRGGSALVGDGNQLVLVPLPPSRLLPAHAHRGRVLDAAGSPITDASVNCVGIDSPPGRRWIGAGADRIAVTDATGSFLLTSDEADAPLYVRVRAPGHATRVVVIPSGVEVTPIRLEPGASVIGRAIDESGPLAGIGIGLVPVERAPDLFLGDLETTTDDAGRFRFDHVATGGVWHLYSKMGDLPGDEVIVRRRVTLTSGTARVALGDLAPSPGRTLRGRIELIGEGAPPAGTRLLVMRAEAWDARPFVVAPDGGFAAVGVPDEPLRLSVRLAGWRMAEGNENLDRDDPYRTSVLHPRAAADEGLRLRLEPRE